MFLSINPFTPKGSGREEITLQKLKLRVKRHGEKNSTIQSFCLIGLMSNGKTMGFDPKTKELQR